MDNPLKIVNDKLESLTIKSGKGKTSFDKKSIAKKTTYINKLKGFRIDNLLFDEKYLRGARIPANYSLEVKYDDGTSLILHAHKEDDKYIAQIQGKPEVFQISKNIFENIFEKF